MWLFIANYYNDFSLNCYLCIVIAISIQLRRSSPRFQPTCTSHCFSAIAERLDLSFMPKSDFTHGKLAITISGSGYCLLLSFSHFLIKATSIIYRQFKLDLTDLFDRLNLLHEHSSQ